MIRDYSDVLKIDDVADILRIGRNATYKLINNGEIKSIRIGRNIRVPKPFLIEFLSKFDYNDVNNMLCTPMSIEKGA